MFIVFSKGAFILLVVQKKTRHPGEYQGECERQVVNQTALNSREGYESLQRSGWNCDGRSEDGFLDETYVTVKEL